MKKFLFSLLLLLLLFGAGGLASAAVTITPVGTNYADKTATFLVSWDAAPYNNRAWVWIDVRPASGAGSYAPAVISEITPSGTDQSSLNGRGFFVTANNTTVTATLSNADGKFNWCAYGSDYPPNATMANGTYTLKGTPPFKINNTITVNEKIFTGTCITSLTDATGYPGIINYPAFSAGALGVQDETMAYPGTAGEFLNVGGTPITVISATAAGGGVGVMYKWFKNNVEIPGATATTYLPPKADAAVAGTFTYIRKAYDAVCYKDAGATAIGNWINVVGGPASTVTSCAVTIAMYPLTETMVWSNANDACQSMGAGWRLPIEDEFNGCMCSGFFMRLGVTSPDRYWSASVHPLDATCCPGSHMYIRAFFTGDIYTACGVACTSVCESGRRYVRCVKSK
jgi:hypothetical protein